jgi:hypothetical protein
MATAKRLGLQIIMARSYSINTKKAACQKTKRAHSDPSLLLPLSQADALKRRRLRKVRFTDV